MQDMPQPINKKPTQNTKQNHMPIPKYKTRGTQGYTRHAPIDEQENPYRTQSKTTYLLKKKAAEGHLPKYKTCPQRSNSQRIQDLPQLINKKPTQNTKQDYMLIYKRRWPKATFQSTRHALNY